jgi:hypothetical protein
MASLHGGGTICRRGSTPMMCAGLRGGLRNGQGLVPFRWQNHALICGQPGRALSKNEKTRLRLYVELGPRLFQW